jgi:hypothetical protein
MVKIGDVVNCTDLDSGCHSYKILRGDGTQSFGVTNLALNAQIDDDFRGVFT